MSKVAPPGTLADEGKVFACHQMMILVEGELKLCDGLTVKEGVRIGVSGNFLFYFFIFFVIVSPTSF